MPRLQGSAIFSLAAGLAVAFSPSFPREAFALGKAHGRTLVPVQPVYLAPQPQPIYQYAPVAAYAPSYTAQAPTYTAQAPVQTANAPTAAPGFQVIYLNGQTAQAPTANAPMGQAPTGTCNLAPDDQQEIVEQLRDMKNRDLKDAGLSEKTTEMRQKASELIAEACGKEVDDLSADDRLLARRLVREANRDSGQAPGNQRYPMIGSAQGGYQAPAPAYPGFVPYVWPMIFQPVVPVQLVAPIARRHHLFCPCHSCKSQRGY